MDEAHPVKTLALVMSNSREKALKKLAEVQKQIQEREKQKTIQEQRQEFRKYFLKCCKKYLKIGKRQLQTFTEDELREVGKLLIKKVAPGTTLQGAGFCGLVATDIAAPVGLAYAMHPLLLSLILPLGAVSFFYWGWMRSRPGWSYRRAYLGLQKQLGPEYFPPKNFLLKKPH